MRECGSAGVNEGSLEATLTNHRIRKAPPDITLDPPQKNQQRFDLNVVRLFPLPYSVVSQWCFAMVQWLLGETNTYQEGVPGNNALIMEHNREDSV